MAISSQGSENRVDWANISENLVILESKRSSWLSLRQLFVLMIVTVQNYDIYRSTYHRKECLINVTGAVSGLMWFFIKISVFWEKIALMRRITDAIPYSIDVRSRNIRFKGSEINSIDIISDIPQWRVDWHWLFVKKEINLLVLTFRSIPSPRHIASNYLNRYLWTVH